MKKGSNFYDYDKYGYTVIYFVRIIVGQLGVIFVAMVIIPICVFALLTILFPMPVKLIQRFKNRGQDNVKRGNNN